MTATATTTRACVPPAASGRRILTGDRPTGPLHLGHYFGTLHNRVRLQREGADLLLVIADYQVITDRDRADELGLRSIELVLDYLACGIDPATSTIFVHSAVPALNQLMLPFLSLVSAGELDRNPTVKQESALAGRRAVSGLMLTYPVHQAADILFCKADLVPVGRDQLPHLELARAIARRFNDRYGELFPLPQALLGEVGVLAGLDGRKMSKSLGNAIALTDPPDRVAAKIKGARTDSERAISFEPRRRPEVANLLRLVGLCLQQLPAEVADRIGNGGGQELKRTATAAINELLEPIQRRRAGFDRAEAARILSDGCHQARQIADRTLAEVNTAMGMDYGGLYRSR
ncbi:MAG: tryptophan--tRNA ligase [Jatrophihabitantaceae bacterium]